MECRAKRWAHSRDPRHGVEQVGYDLVGAMIKRRRLLAGLTQRQLEALTGIDQTVISRLENGIQYGLRWSRFAILVAKLHGLEDETAEAPPPWWVTYGVTVPAYRVESLQQQGLLPPDYKAPIAKPADDEELTVQAADDQAPTD